jgi:hypothetical protein
MATRKRRRRTEPGAARPVPRQRRRVAAASLGPAPAAVAERRLDYAVVYVHGIGRQDPPAQAKAGWDTALFGEAMLETDMAYWADLRHPVEGGPGARTLRQRPDRALEGSEARRFMQELEEALAGRLRRTAAGTVRGQVFGWLPGVGDTLFEWVTKGFIRDTAAYFFDAAQRRAMQQRLIDVLARANKPVVLLAHSQGSIIAYDVLRRLDGRTPSRQPLRVALLVTLGSPLGIDEVQRKLTQPLRVPGGVQAWANFADGLDPVALDKDLAGEFAGEVRIQDARVRNPIPMNPHSALGYLSTAEVRSSAYSVLGWNQLRYGSRVRRDVLADVIRSLAARELDVGRAPEERHPVLVELRDPAGFGEAAVWDLAKGQRSQVNDLAQHRRHVVEFLGTIVTDKAAARIDPLKRYVAARLTPPEIQRVEAECRTSVYTVWRNSTKRALIHRSADVVQVPAARTAYRAEGEGVAWAVLWTPASRAATPTSRRTTASSVSGTARAPDPWCPWSATAGERPTRRAMGRTSAGSSPGRRRTRPGVPERTGAWP